MNKFIVQNLPAKMCWSFNEYDGKIGLLTFNEKGLTFITDNLGPFTDEIAKINFSEVMYHKTIGYGFAIENKNNDIYCLQTDLDEKDIKEILAFYNKKLKLSDYKNQLNEIEKEENIRKRNIKLSRLMSKMEFDFQIPGLNNEEFNKENNEVITLYREISNARNFDEKGGISMEDKLKLKCTNCNEILKLEFAYDGCDWNSVEGEGSGYNYTVDLVCPNCGRIYPIVRTKGEFDAVEYIEKLRPYNS